MGLDYLAEPWPVEADDPQPAHSQPLLRTGHLVDHDRVHHVTARRLRLVADEPREVNLDGEVAALMPATFEVDRNALHVVVPAHSRAARTDTTATA